MVAISKMSVPRAEFIVEANAVIWCGHLARCATLAETLATFVWRTTLRAQDDRALILPAAVGMFFTLA